MSDDTGRGFASTQWTQEEGPGFAEGGFKPQSAGFSADRYQAVVMPLSEKSKTTLRLMGDTEGADGFSSDNVKQREPESPNAHLPFVMDVYGVKPAATKTLQASPTHDDVGDDTQAQAQHDEDALQAQTSEDEVSESEPHVEAAEAVDAEAEQATQAEASEELDAQPNAESAQDSEPEQSTEDEQETQLEQAAQPEQETQPEQDLAESELITDDSAGEPQALAAEIDEVLAQEPVPPAAPVVVGIDPEEVAQREAEHFAQGLAQGIEQGERQAREAMQQEVAAQCAVLSAVTHDLNALLQDPKKFFEPLKRLALHVAEHVVMKELSTSTEAIERLVQRCLDELDHPAKGAVVVELSPQDKERLQAQDSALVAGMRLDAVKGMKPGSVRLFANDTVVEDLVEHRLEALARSLLVDVEDWRAKSVLAQPEVVASESEPESEIEDVEPKDVHS